MFVECYILKMEEKVWVRVFEECKTMSKKFGNGREKKKECGNWMREIRLLVEKVVDTVHNF